MLEDNKEDILNKGLEFSLISLFSKKLRVGIVGGGRAGYIKAKHFFSKGCMVEVLGKSVIKEIEELESNNLKIINKEYEKAFIDNKHLIVIAIDDEEKRKEIKRDCESQFKIYIDSTNFVDGMGSIPMQKDLENIVVGINTRGGNPKGARLLGNKVEEELKKYDDFIGFTTILRNTVKYNEEIKRVVTDFISTEDFFFFYKKGRGKVVLRMFFGEKGANYE